MRKSPASRLETRIEESSVCASTQYRISVCTGKATWNVFSCQRRSCLNYVERERVHQDPKDGELCPCQAKAGETLMQAFCVADVQIVRLTWV